MNMMKKLITLVITLSLISCQAFADPSSGNQGGGNKQSQKVLKNQTSNSNKSNASKKSSKNKSSTSSSVTSTKPPGLQKNGKSPAGLENQGKTPSGWTKGEKEGWDKTQNVGKDDLNSSKGPIERFWDNFTGMFR